MTRQIKPLLGHVCLLFWLWCGCRPAPQFQETTQQLWRMKAEERWRNIALFPQDFEHPSLLLLAVSSENDHISRVQSLLYLSETKWESGVREQLLARILSDKDALVRATAAYILPSARTLSSSELHQLRSKLSDRSWHVRRYVLRALLALESSRTVLEDVCRRSLRDPHPAVRWDAILCWRQYKLDSKEGAEGLAPLLRDPNPRVQQLTIQSLGWWGKSALGILAEATRDKAEEVRCNALSALSAFRHSYPNFIPWMVAAIQDPSESVQACAVRSLSELAPHTDLVILPLIQATKHPQMIVALDAISALHQMGERAHSAVPALRSIYLNPQQPIFKRYQTAQAVLQILSDLRSPTRIEADTTQNKLSPFVKEALFQKSREVLASSIEVSFHNIWTPRKYGNDLIHLIRKDYLADFQTCNLTNQEGKLVTKTYWIELFLERHGEVVVPFVFALDRKTEVHEPCLTDHLWAWNFPRLLSERYAYIQFQIKLEPVEDGKIITDPNGSNSPSILIK